VAICKSHHILLWCFNQRDLAGPDIEHALKREEMQTYILAIKRVKNNPFKA
jgi:hypothetical protein